MHILHFWVDLAATALKCQQHLQTIASFFFAYVEKVSTHIDRQAELMETLTTIIDYKPNTSTIQTTFRWLLGAALTYTGTGHLTFSRQEFRAQVPQWVPVDVDLVVLLSGVVEILLGFMLIFLPRYRASVGWLTALFFVAIFPGNISQYVNGIDAFGLDTDRKRLVRLFFQPVLVVLALWSTGAWEAWKKRNEAIDIDKG